MADFKDALVFPSKYGNWIDFLATLFFSFLPNVQMLSKHSQQSKIVPMAKENNQTTNQRWRELRGAADVAFVRESVGMRFYPGCHNISLTMRKESETSPWPLQATVRPPPVIDFEFCSVFGFQKKHCHKSKYHSLSDGNNYSSSKDTRNFSIFWIFRWKALWKRPHNRSLSSASWLLSSESIQ